MLITRGDVKILPKGPVMWSLMFFVVNWTSSWTNGRYTGHETQWRNYYITVMVHFGTMLLLTLNVKNFSWRIWNTVHNMSMHTAVLSFLLWCCQFLLHLIDLIIHISQGFSHCHWDNCTVAPVHVKESWWVWANRQSSNKLQCRGSNQEEYWKAVGPKRGPHAYFSGCTWYNKTDVGTPRNPRPL